MAERRQHEPSALPPAVVDDQPTGDEFAATRMLGIVLIAALIFWGAVLGVAVWLVVVAR
jgi:hypothetical protein